MPGPGSFPRGMGMSGRTGMSRGWVCPGVGMSHPLVLTLSGGHHTYGWQVGGTHPTGRLSYFTRSI